MLFIWKFYTSTSKNILSALETYFKCEWVSGDHGNVSISKEPGEVHRQLWSVTHLSTWQIGKQKPITETLKVIDSLCSD